MSNAISRSKKEEEWQPKLAQSELAHKGEVTELRCHWPNTCTSSEGMRTRKGDGLHHTSGSDMALSRPVATTYRVVRLLTLLHNINTYYLHQ